MTSNRHQTRKNKPAPEIELRKIALNSLIIGVICLMRGIPGITASIPTAWVQLRDLTALHPCQKMLKELDYNLSQLKNQRRLIYQQYSIVAPPTRIVMPATSLPALPQPERSIIPTYSIDPLLQQDYEALQQRLLLKGEKELANFRDDINADSEMNSGSSVGLETAESDASAREQTIAQQYRLPIITAYISLDHANELVSSAEQLYTRAQNAYQDAGKTRDAAQSYSRQYQKIINNSCLPPTSDQIKKANQANAALEEADQQLASSAETLKRAKNMLDDRLALQKKCDLTVENLECILDIEMQNIQSDLASARQHLSLEKQNALDVKITQKKAEIQNRITQKLAEKNPRGDAFAHNNPEITAPSFPVFTATSLTPILLNVGGLQFTYAKTKQYINQKIATETQEIDSAIKALEQQQKAVNDIILQDTRAAAINLAAQHHVNISFTPGHGKDLTSSMMRWLKYYWNQ